MSQAQAQAQPTYAFRRGRWMEVPALPFSDPLLTPTHLQFASAVVATELARGSSQQHAEQIAEKKMYERIYGAAAQQAAAPVLRITRKEHRTPQDKEEDTRVQKES